MCVALLTSRGERSKVCKWPPNTVAYKSHIHTKIKAAKLVRCLGNRAMLTVCGRHGRCEWCRKYAGNVQWHTDWSPLMTILYHVTYTFPPRHLWFTFKCSVCFLLSSYTSTGCFSVWGKQMEKPESWYWTAGTNRIRHTYVCNTTIDGVVTP